MSKRLQYFLIALIGFLILLIFILIGVAIYYATNTATKQSNTTNTVVSSTVVKQTNPAPQPAPQPAPTPTITTKVFENSYVKFSYPSDWNVVLANDYQINVEKGNYILYFNTQAQQASG